MKVICIAVAVRGNKACCVLSTPVLKVLQFLCPRATKLYVSAVVMNSHLELLTSQHTSLSRRVSQYIQRQLQHFLGPDLELSRRCNTRTPRDSQIHTVDRQRCFWQCSRTTTSAKQPMEWLHLNSHLAAGCSRS